MEERSRLQVEGVDDRHVIRHLLRRHGLSDGECGPVFPEIRDVGGRASLLDGIRPGVLTSTGRSIGFVLDSNSSVDRTWTAVSQRLREVEVDVSVEMPIDGFIGQATRHQARVGVWLMPDNQQEGDLEGFVAGLARGAAPRIVEHAEAATSQAVVLGARVPPTAMRKAVLHAWLAWQETPGLPYGAAIGAHYLRHDTAAATGFVAWFRRLFGIASA